MTISLEKISLTFTLFSGGALFYFLLKHEQNCIEFIKELQTKYPTKWKEAGGLTEKDIRIGKAYKLRTFINKSIDTPELIKRIKNINTSYRYYGIAGVLFLVSALVYISER